MNPAHAGDVLGTVLAAFALARTAGRTQLDATVMRRAKLEGLAVFSVVLICGSSDRVTIHRNNAVALSRSPFRIGTTTAGITRPTAEPPPHQTR